MNSFDQQNPYKATEAPESAKLTATPSIVDSLRQTRPWVLFLSVLGFVIGGFTAFAGLVFLGMSVAGAGPAAGMPAAFGAIYLIFAALYVPPSIYLLRYARHIKTLVASPSTQALEQTLAAQKSFWRFVGILMLSIVGLYATFLLIGLIATVAGLFAN